MIPIRCGWRQGRSVCGRLLLGASVVFAAGICSSQSRWDREGAQAALVRARGLRDEISLTQNPLREKYLECISAYRQVYLKDPHYSGSDDAIYEAGVMYQEMGERFGGVTQYRNAARQFHFLLKDYDASPRCPDALLRLGDLYAGALEDEVAAQQAYRELETRYRSSQAAAALALKQSSAIVLPESPKDEAPFIADVRNIRHWSTSDYTRILIDMDAKTRFTKTRLSNPDRIYLDIMNSRLAADLSNKTFVVGDELLKQVRVGQNRRDVVRVVFDFETISDYSLFELHDPYRIVVDIHGKKNGGTNSLHTTPSPARIPESALAVAAAPLASSAADRGQAAAPAAVEKQAKSAGPSAPGPSPKAATSMGTPEKPPAPGRTPPPARAEVEPRALPKAAAKTSSGDRTLTRILGLKIGRIVIDPGHGGHDTGSIGPGGLLEKDLVLKVALDLKQLLEERLAAEVILTRADDTFISLEERTAIANQARADLFISIHANSSSSRAISGVETYYLDFAKTESAREVAARENASTVQNVRDLESLIRKIAQADKSAESREFAAILQKKLFGGTRQLFPSARDRGVRSAPFVVLIGANMPSVLTEVAFISNPRDEKLLQKADSRQHLADALFAGVEGYIKTLGSDMARSLSGGH